MLQDVADGLLPISLFQGGGGLNTLLPDLTNVAIKLLSVHIGQINQSSTQDYKVFQKQVLHSLFNLSI